jgi:hypothetical protein
VLVLCVPHTSRSSLTTGISRCTAKTESTSSPSSPGTRPGAVLARTKAPGTGTRRPVTPEPLPTAGSSGIGTNPARDHRTRETMCRRVRSGRSRRRSRSPARAGSSSRTLGPAGQIVSVNDQWVESDGHAPSMGGTLDRIPEACCSAADGRSLEVTPRHSAQIV